MNKLRRWSYPKVISKLERMTEEQGISLEKVSPAYTSQTCSYCGAVDKNSRRNSVFLCTACKIELDADFNASRNILPRGVYRLSTTNKYLSC
ncbi:MAG: transposase [Actinobacteria bacterium]|nr:transposase [Actinomycetota bacterium]